MSVALAKPEPKLAGADVRLVEECLAGSETAWAALINKYKNLIFSIPVKYGFSRDDAAEIFQAVCVELFTQLPNLRNPQGLAKWLMQVTAHRCYQWKRQQARFVYTAELPEPPAAVPSAALPEKMLREVEAEQMLRDAMERLKPRCRELMQMLFFEQPARPYGEIAASLGLATGSIGFIRGRCLERLRALLDEAGFAE